MCLLGVALILLPFRGQNFHFESVSRRFQARCARYSKFCIIETNYYRDSNQILHIVKDQQLLFMYGSFLNAPNKFDMEDGHHFQNKGKLQYLSNRLNYFDDPSSGDVSTPECTSWWLG